MTDARRPTVHDKLDALTDGQAKMERSLAVHLTFCRGQCKRVEQLEKRFQGHDITLRGNGGRIGLAAKIWLLTSLVGLLASGIGSVIGILIGAYLAHLGGLAFF